MNTDGVPAEAFVAALVPCVRLALGLSGRCFCRCAIASPKLCLGRCLAGIACYRVHSSGSSRNRGWESGASSSRSRSIGICTCSITTTRLLRRLHPCLGSCQPPHHRCCRRIPLLAGCKGVTAIAIAVAVTIGGCSDMGRFLLLGIFRVVDGRGSRRSSRSNRSGGSTGHPRPLLLFPLLLPVLLLLPTISLSSLPLAPALLSRCDRVCVFWHRHVLLCHREK